MNLNSPHWLKRLWKDFTKKEFIPIKVLFFIIYGASLAMFPFLTLQARSLGINERELGIVYAFNPVIAILGPPLTGMIADRIGNFKFFLSLTMAASGAAALTFSAVPQSRFDHKLPESLPLSLTCGGPLGTDLDLILDLPYRCDFVEDLSEVNVTLTNCSLCGSERSLDFVVEEEQEQCQEEGPDSAGCVISQYFSNVTRQMVAKPIREDEGNITRFKVVDWTCPEVSLESVDLAVADTVSYSSGEETAPVAHRAANCTLQCQATITRDGLCSNKVTQEVFDPMLTFWMYLLVRILNSLTLATSFTLFDGAAIAVVKEHKGDYGLQRLYANLGGIVVTPISGQLIDYFSDLNNMQDYRPAFYLYCCLKILGAIIILFVDLDFRQPSNKVLKDFRSLIKKPEIVAFLTVMLISGTCFGLLDTFLFWLLQDLGASKFLMGITVTVGSVAGIPILIASGFIFKKLGLANTIVLGIMAYVVRLVGYSFLTNPWWCMPFESLECFTVSLMGAAAVSYAADLSTPSTLATLQGTYGGLHYGVGRGVGSLVGGFLLKPIGVRNTYRLAGVFCLVSGITYFIINKIYFQAKQDERRKIQDEEKRKRKKAEAEPEVEAIASSKEKHNGVIENGVKVPAKENVSLDNIKPDVNAVNSTVAHNAAFVADE